MLGANEKVCEYESIKSTLDCQTRTPSLALIACDIDANVVHKLFLCDLPFWPSNNGEQYFYKDFIQNMFGICRKSV